MVKKKNAMPGNRSKRNIEKGQSISNIKNKSEKTKNIILSSGLILIIALSIRFAYYYQMKGTYYYNALFVDEQYHNDLGKQIARGEGYKQAYFRAPFYYYFIGYVYKIFGSDFNNIRIIQIFLDSISAVILFFLLLLLFNNIKPALLFALIYSLYANNIFYTFELLMPALINFFNISGLFLLLLFFKKKKAGYLIASSFILGLSTICRPNLLLFALGFVFFYFIIFRKIKPIIIFLIFFSIPILPITYHNYKAANDFILISHQGGTTFYLGNHKGADAISGEFSWTKSRGWASIKEAYEIPEKELGRKLKPSQVSSYYFNKAFDFIKNNPVEYLKLEIRKIYFFFNRFEIRNNKDFYVVAEYNKVYKYALPYIVIVSLFFISIILILIKFYYLTKFKIKPMIELSKEQFSLIAVFLFFLSYFASVILFYVNSRYRMPLIPAMLILSGLGMQIFYDFYKNKNYKPIYISAGAAVLLLIIFNIDYYKFKSFKENPTTEYCQLAAYYISQNNNNDYYKALDILEQALKSTNYEQGKIYKELAAVYLKLKNIDKAIHFGKIAEREKINNADLFYNLGTAYAMKNDFTNAKKYYEMAYNLNKEDIIIINDLASTYLNLNEYKKAKNLYEKALQIKKNEPRLLLNYSYCLINLKEYDKAMKILNQILQNIRYKRMPEYSEAKRFKEYILKNKNKK